MVVVVVMISAARVTPRAERRNRMAKRRLRVTLAGSLTVVALALAACGTDSCGGGGASATVQIWEGYTGPEAKAFAHLITVYQNQHPGEKVSSLYVNNDNTLQKVLTAVRGGRPPDIAFLFGALAAHVAPIPHGGDPTHPATPPPL